MGSEGINAILSDDLGNQYANDAPKVHKSFVLIHPDDNVLVCSAHTPKGSAVLIDGVRCILSSDILIGHKIARTDMAVGAKVIRYGCTIGTVTHEIVKADHVHSHNLTSDYIAPHNRRATQSKRPL